MSNSIDAFNKIIRLHYNLNKQSPLFARAAELELEKNNIDEAINILSDGLQIFPDYPTAYFLLGRAYSIKGNYFLALSNIKKGSQLVHSSKTFDYYFREINTIKKQRSLFNFSRWSDTSNKNFAKLNSDLTSHNSDESVSKGIEETLTNLTFDIDKTHLYKSEKENAGQIVIVSETLAKIYIEQKQFNEAISMYEKLKQNNPDKEEYFNKKIEDLKRSIGK